MATELTIPQSAYDKADEIAGRYPDREAAAHIAAEVMTEVVPLIVASELARLADEIYDEAEGTYGGFPDGIGVAVDIVRYRASELRREA
jgi:hypothetical protein